MPNNKAHHHLAWWQLTIVAALVLFGVTLICYPFVASYLNRFSQASAIDGYLDDAASESAQQMDAQLQEAFDYNQQLLNASTVMSDPFSAEAFQAALDRYDEILDVSPTGIMGYLDIPSIKVHLPIYHGTGTYALQHGVGHLQSTSLPVGGKSTHAVLSAHSGLTNADMFDDLPDVAVGDLFSVTVLSQTIWYEVYETEVILPEETQSLTIRPGEDLVTLMTCTPYGINTHRLLVHGRRTDAPVETTEDEAQVQNKTEQHLGYTMLGAILVLIVGSALGAAIAAAVLYIRRRY